jgi:hypothetical protein
MFIVKGVAYVKESQSANLTPSINSNWSEGFIYADLDQVLTNKYRF